MNTILMQVAESWSPFFTSEFGGMIAEMKCEKCDGKLNYKGFAKEGYLKLLHRHFSICKNCGKIVEF